MFVDALLPGEPPTTPVTSAALLEHLRPLADAEGRLPVWTRWWPDEELAGLFADPEQRRAVERGQRRLPLAYLESEVPSPAGWEQLPAAFLGFGDAYWAERERARAAGWPVAVLPGGHLHPLVQPRKVADAITRAARPGNRRRPDNRVGRYKACRVLTVTIAAYSEAIRKRHGTAQRRTFPK